MSAADPTAHDRLKQLFEQGAALDTEARTRWLDELRSTDPDTAAELAGLLSHHDRTGAVLDVSPAALLDLDPSVDTAPPAAIGPYTIIREIARGGMGVVYEARQDFPDRVVALKLVRPEAASPSLVRRLSHEAQLLARLDHPNIAHVLDAGVLEVNGRTQPYIAMDLVRGAPITQHATAASFDVRSRAALLALVCDGIDHAHRRGVIHRDLKPSNILIDERGSPRILDFGIARYTDDTAHLTVATSPGQILGTLSYMSPEQAAGDTRHVDSRTDVYALGVILYELLTGSPPISTQDRSLHEALRAIQEDEPPRPRLGDSVLPRDLEVILQRALAKQPADRYQHASDLAADLRRFLSDEPISARPYTAREQLARFARRHRPLVASAAAALVTLLLALVVISALAFRIADQRDEAKLLQAAEAEARATAEAEADNARAVTEFLSEIIATAHPERSRGTPLSMVDALDFVAGEIEPRFADRPVVLLELRNVMGSAYGALGQLERSAEFYTAALSLAKELHPDDPRLWADPAGQLAAALEGLDRYEEARDQIEPVLAALTAAGYGDTDFAATIRMHMGAVYQALGRMEEAEPLLRSAFEARERILGPEHRDTMVAANLLALFLRADRRPEEATPLARRNYETTARNLGEDHPDALAAATNLAILLSGSGEQEEALRLLETALPLSRRVLGEDHQNTVAVMQNLGTVLSNAGEYDRALPLLRETYERARADWGDEHSLTLSTKNNLAYTYERAGRLEEARVIAAELYDTMMRLNPDSPNTLVVTVNLGRVTRALGQTRPALSYYDTGLITARRVLPDPHPLTATLRLGRGLCLLQLGDDTAAAEVRAAYESLAEIQGRDHPRTRAVAATIATAYDELGDTENAAAWRTLSQTDDR